MQRKTLTRGAVLAGGALAAVLLAGCQSGSSASGSAAPASIPNGPVTATSTVVVPPPVIDTQTTVTSPTPAAPAAGGATTTTKARTAASNECKANDLRLAVGASDGSAGHVYAQLTFTNISSSNCVMQGWPGVSYVTGDNGTQVGSPAARDGSKGSELTLTPGGVSSATVEMTDVGVFNGSACQPTPVRGFRVYAPDDTASLYVARPTTGCMGATPSPQLRVQTVKPGAGGA
jgi:hypothetical protein